MENEKKTDQEKLQKWQDRLSLSDTEYGEETEKMDKRELLYNGDNRLEKVVVGDEKDLTTPHVRNIVFENIEAQVSSSVPSPKVTPRRAKDEKLAAIVEHWLRNELDRLPFERINDMAERTVPMQGGVGYLPEWDHKLGRAGELVVSVVHPKQFGPQPGVYTDISDMDWFIVKVPTTKGEILRNYGVDLSQEGESEPEIRTVGGERSAAEALTQYIGFHRNDHGGVDKYSWVNNIQLEDVEDYQGRRLDTCTQCGRIRPSMGQVISTGPAKGNLLPDPETGMPVEQPQAETYDGGPCPFCGCDKFEKRVQEYQEVYVTITSPGGVVIPGEHLEDDGNGGQVMVPTKIPFYKPNVIPVVLQKSVSVYGQLLGNSDVDQIKTQQNSINRLEKKILDRLCKAGSKITLPNKANFKVGTEDGDVIRVEKPVDKSLIGTYTFSGDLRYEMTYLNQLYEEARQIIGITDSFQGRHDATATSGKAKEFAAAQAAGRMESKRIMKNAAYANLFEIMFKFALAYLDQPMTVSYKDYKGQTLYEEFNRYDFLEQDENGNWIWNDQFLFSCDTAAALASNREAMWQETVQMFKSGAFGDPHLTETQIILWEKMEMLHYPGAGDTKKYLEDRKEKEQTSVPTPPEADPMLQAAAGGVVPGMM